MTNRFQKDTRKKTPYYPQTNDQTKRVNETLVNILCKTIHNSKSTIFPTIAIRNNGAVKIHFNMILVPI
jgi:hypothetical protein